MDGAERGERRMDFEYKLVSSLCKVFPGGENMEEMRDRRITGLKGETLSFQIAYYWGGGRRERGSAAVVSPIANRVHVRTVNLVPCEYPCHTRRDPGYLTHRPGLYPDRLSEISGRGFPLVDGQWRCLWIDVELDDGMEAGDYPVKIRMEAQGAVLCEPQILCRVVDCVLPPLPIPHTEWFHSDCLADYYQVEVFSERHWEIIRAFVKSAAQHRCNMLLTPVFTPPLDTAVGGERPTVQLVDVTVLGEGKYGFGFEKLRRWVDMARECGIEYFEFSHLFTQWGAKAAPKIMAVKNGEYVQIFGWDTDAAGGAYRTFLHQFLTALKKELADMGISQKCYFHISDEPSMDHLESYRKAWEAAAPDLEGYEMIDALSHYDFYEKGLVRQPVCAVDAIQPFLEKRPERLWCYYCTSQCVDVPNRFIALPGYRTRILGTLLYKYRLDGFLHWGYNFYYSERSLYSVDPYRSTDADGSFPSGDPFLVYPGADGKPEGSIRQMLMDEAMTDYCAFTALERLAGRETVLELIDGEKVAFDEYPQEASWLLRLRERVNEVISRLRAGAVVLALLILLTGFLRPDLGSAGSCPIVACAAEEESGEEREKLLANYENYRSRLEGIEKQADIGHGGFRVIEDQVFAIETKRFGEVCLVPALEEKYSRLVLFFTKADGTVVERTDQLETNNRRTGELEQPVKSISAVSFQDLNRDGLMDIVLITTCANRKGAYAGKPYKIGDVLFQSEEGFYRDYRISDKINRFGMNKSVESITAFVRDGYSTEFLYTATSRGELLGNGFSIAQEQCYPRRFEKLGKLEVVPGTYTMANFSTFMIYLIDEQGNIVWSFQPMGDFDNLYALKGITCRDIDGDGMKDILVLARYSYEGNGNELMIESDYSIYYQRTGGFYADTEVKKKVRCDEESTVAELVEKARACWGWKSE